MPLHKSGRISFKWHTVSPKIQELFKNQSHLLEGKCILRPVLNTRWTIYFCCLYISDNQHSYYMCYKFNWKEKSYSALNRQQTVYHIILWCRHNTACPHISYQSVLYFQCNMGKSMNWTFFFFVRCIRWKRNFQTYLKMMYRTILYPLYRFGRNDNNNVAYMDGIYVGHIFEVSLTEH